MLPEVLLPETLSPEGVALGPFAEPEVLPLVMFPDPEDAVSGDATGVAELELDALDDDDESELEVVVLALLPHDVIAVPMVRQSMLIFNIFIVLFF